MGPIGDGSLALHPLAAASARTVTMVATDAAEEWARWIDMPSLAASGVPFVPFPPRRGQLGCSEGDFLPQRGDFGQLSPCR